MKLEQQVVSLELAQKLKELGVKQGSFFGWFEQDKPFLVYDEDRSSADYSAFTVAELGEMLKGITSTWFDDKKWICAYVSKEEKKNIRLEYADTEADARAKMLVYLLENKLITL